MLEYKIVDAKDKDSDILTSIKLVTMIDDEMDKILSYNEKSKIRKNVIKNIELTCDQYKIIYVDKKIAGAYVVIPYEDGSIIDEIYLFEEYRNKGIGTDIINQIKSDIPSLYIWVYKNNEKAIRLFSRLGFNTISKGRTLIMKCDSIYAKIKDKLADVRLGYRDKDGNKYVKFKSDFKEKFYLQSPKQMMESKIGTCFDQVEYEREVISKADIDYRTYFIYYPHDDKIISHAFLIYKDSKKYYWVENAWLKYRGLHIYDSKQDLFNDVLHKFVDTIPDGEFKKVRLYMYEKPRYGINYIRLLSHCVNTRSMKIK